MALARLEHDEPVVRPEPPAGGRYHLGSPVELAASGRGVVQAAWADASVPKYTVLLDNETMPECRARRDELTRYAARISDGMLYGRVSRLFVTPLLRALRRVVPPNRYLEFLDSFHNLRERFAK